MKNEVWDHVCGTMQLWDSLAIVNLVILLLLGFSFLFIEQGTGAFVAAVLTLVVVATYFVVYGVLRWACAKREDADRYDPGARPR